jgi:hypothetical protein
MTRARLWTTKRTRKPLLLLRLQLVLEPARKKALHAQKLGPRARKPSNESTSELLCAFLLKHLPEAVAVLWLRQLYVVVEVTEYLPIVQILKLQSSERCDLRVPTTNSKRTCAVPAFAYHVSGSGSGSHFLLVESWSL